MKEPTYRDAIRHAISISMHHPLLWVFGFFAAFIGQLGLMDYVAQLTFASSNYVWYPLVLQLKELLIAAKEGVMVNGLSASQLLWLGWIVIFFVGIGAFLLFISVSSQGALIHGVTQSIGKTKKQINVAKAWHAGTYHVWRLMGITLLKKFIIGLFVFLIGISLYNAVTSGLQTGELTVYFLLYLIASIAAAVVSLIAVYAAGYVVIEEYRLTDAIHEAWYLFREHWLVSLEVAGIVLCANVLAHLIAIVLVVLLLVQMAVLWAIAVMLHSAFFWMVCVVFGGFLFIITAAFIGTMISVFTTTIWTYLFMKMHRKGIKSRILHALGM